ncbi:MAG: dephospho-CoA kinase [candidate division WOR-3 bacterium]|nr:dephospho-CoA kinase [candidate division WOR-3 bacterium]
MFDRKLSQDRLLVGIGGNMGSGKSTVASELKRYGAKIIDADEMGWLILNKGTDEYHRLVKTFGRGILTKTGNIDRRALGKLAFASKASLAKLNAITHPPLLQRVRKEMDRNRKGLVVLDAALLFAWGMDKEVDVSILVTAADRLKTKRMIDAGVPEDDIVARLKLQSPDAKIWRKADFVLENRGSFAELRRKCRALWNFFYSAKFQAFKAARRP